MNRLAAALLLVLTLALGACAPVPPQAVPPEPSGSAEASDPEQAEPQTTGTGEPESDGSPEPIAESAGPEETTKAVESEAADEELEPAPEPDPEPVQQTRAPAEAASEPAPETPVVDRDIALSGRVTLSGDAAPEEAVVYFVPSDAEGMAETSDRPETYDVVTRDKSLSPTVLAVARGTEIRFPNQDPILHNLFSVSADNGFDLGVYGPEEAPSVTFEHPGIVNIYCNVHHDMHAHVLVVDTPFRTRPDPDGNFRLSGLPAGRGELHVWHRQSNRWSRTLELPAAGAFEVTLEVTKPRLPPHRDKTGQSYNRRDRDPYR